RLIQETARDFVDKELVPHVREWEAKGEVPKAFYAKMANLGFLGAPVPEKYGGAGMDYVAFMLLVEEISRGSSSVRTTVSVQTSLSETSLLWFGSEEQKKRWLVPLAKGTTFGAWALTEPQAGSDAGNLQTTARLDGDEWVLEGQKRFISNGSLADLIQVYAREPGTSRHEGISLFMVPRDAPGFKVTHVETTTKLGLRAAQLRDLGLDNTLEVSMAKLYGAQMAQRVTDWAIQVHGGYGFSGDFDVERYYRDARILGLYEGTNEIQKLIIADRTLGPTTK